MWTVNIFHGEKLVATSSSDSIFAAEADAERKALKHVQTFNKANPEAGLAVRKLRQESSCA